jgi:glycosyltransferase involved in cell wall biosynthesis
MASRVTVVIPVFNRPIVVRRAVASVLAQTWQDFEIVIVDDASTDETPATLAALAAGDERIRIVRHDRTRGGSAARNTGVSVATAPYVAFLDSDDEWLPLKLERQLQAFENHGPDTALVFTGVEVVYDDGTITRSVPPRAPTVLELLTVNVVGSASVGMLRRDSFLALGGFDERLPASQDWDLWVRVQERYALAAVPELLVRIVAASDPGRISANLSGVLQGRELFSIKHGQKLRDHGVLHVFLRHTGWVHHRLIRESRPARRCYIESLKVAPTSLTTYALLMSTAVPMAWLDAVAATKHRTTALWRTALSFAGRGRQGRTSAASATTD